MGWAINVEMVNMGRLDIVRFRAFKLMASRTLAVLGVSAVACGASVVGCRGTSATVGDKGAPGARGLEVETTSQAPSSERDGQLEAETRGRELAAALAVLEVQTDPGWLVVTGVDERAEGGWATGEFDAERNRLNIDTEHVTGFALDVRRVPVDWTKLVVVRLNGRSSELRKRDAAVYRFTLDSQGQWTVEE